MNELTVIGNSIKTMTSLEISELVESRHDKVRQSIERLAERGVISLPPMGEVKIQRERREEKVSVYLIDKRSSLIVVAQLSPEFTARVVDRWQELETGAATPANPNEGPWYTLNELADRWGCGYTTARFEIDKQIIAKKVVKQKQTGTIGCPVYYRFVDGDAPTSRPSRLISQRPTTAPRFQTVKPYQANAGFRIPFGAMIVTADQISAMVADHAIVPRELLPEIISAATVRLISTT